MSAYIDGFVFPVSTDRIEEYRRVAETVAEIYKEHGAIDYCEFVGDDMKREGTQPFPELLSANEKETVVFGWITYDSRDSRDWVNRQVEKDPRMADLVGPLLDPDDPVFNPARMAFGGFSPLVGSAE